VIVNTPHGHCAIVDGDAADPRALGRAALSAALAVLDPAAAAMPISRDDRGAPVLPAGWLGSISHKHARAAALAARDDGSGARIGVDLERAIAPRQPIERRILTARELAALAGDRRAISRCFAIKEAIYKAIDPFVRRYVAFAEVEIELELDTAAAGACAVRVVDPTRLPVAIDAWSCELDGYWLATARATAS
jgi:enterobactin synthetase component D